ncbi:MAG: hypothetical protein WBN70_17050 [Polyangiales bacterium]
MAQTKIILGLLLGLGLTLSACGDSTDPQSACASCPESVRNICEDGVQNCLDIGGAFADECVDAITRACQGE